MKPTLKRIAVLAAAGTAFAASNAGAANTFFEPQDLMLFFQEDGGSNTVYVSLGNSATAFRGSATGAGDASLQQVNFLNINSSLITAFGINWATNPNIYAGLTASWSNSTSAVQQNADPGRTIYVSQGRNSVGTAGLADSSGYSGFTNTNMSSMANSVINMYTPFENLVDPGAQQSVLDTSVSTIDENHPISGGIQGNALGNTIGGGIQQQGASGTFGNFSAVGDVEFALDLYRILARSSTGTTGQTLVSGQIDGPHRTGTFEGTITVGTDGQVSFLTVPEPSTSILAGLAAGAAFLRRRRNA
jgi:PEP-CTERM motif